MGRHIFSSMVLLQVEIVSLNDDPLPCAMEKEMHHVSNAQACTAHRDDILLCNIRSRTDILARHSQSTTEQEKKEDLAELAEMIGSHAAMEEQLLYPASLLIGEYMKALAGRK